MSLNGCGQGGTGGAGNRDRRSTAASNYVRPEHGTETAFVRKRGRFASPLSNGDLLRLVAKAVVLLAPDGDPAKLTQALFDRSRAELGFPDAPSAKQIAARFKQPWRDLCFRVATAKQVDRLWEPTRADANDGERRLDERHAFFAIRLAAARLGRSPRDEAELKLTFEQLVAADRNRWRHGGLLQHVLPTTNQALRIAGGMNGLLALGGLPPHERPKRAQGLSVVEAISAYIDATGYLPHRRQLEDFARVNGFALQRRKPGKEWAAYIADTRTLRASILGLSTPTGFDQRNRPQYGPVRLPAQAEAYKPRKRWTTETIIARLIDYLDVVERAAEAPRPSNRDYRARQREHEDWPPASTVARYGAFPDLLAKARTVRADERRR